MYFPLKCSAGGEDILPPVFLLYRHTAEGYAINA